MKIDTKYNIRKIVCAFFLYAVTYTIVIRQMNEFIFSDYIPHAAWATTFKASFPEKLTYPMWHIGVKIFSLLTDHSTTVYAAAITTGLATVLAYLCIMYEFEKNNIMKAELVGLGLMFVTGIYIPWYNPHIYLYTGSPNTWHNPTNIMVKPFAIFSIFVIYELCLKIHNNINVSVKEYIILAVGLFLSVLAKPSFFQGIVPGLGLFMVLSAIVTKGKTIKGHLCIIASFVPAAIVFVWQFYVSFVVCGENEGIGFGWNELGKISPYDLNPFISLILVLMFPLAFFFLNIKEYYKKIPMQITLLYTSCAWLESVFLYEKGGKKNNGNLTWAANLAYSVIFVYTTIELIKKLQCKPENNYQKYKNITLFSIWCMHLMCGIYYVYQLIFVEGVLL